MPKKRNCNSEIAEAVDDMLLDFVKAGLLSKRAYDKIFDRQLEAKVLERIKCADTSKFITHEELKNRLGIKD